MMPSPFYTNTVMWVKHAPVSYLDGSMQIIQAGSQFLFSELTFGEQAFAYLY